MYIAAAWPNEDFQGARRLYTRNGGGVKNKPGFPRFHTSTFLSTCE